MNENLMCPNCGNIQWSVVDQQYLKLYGHCWREDCDSWHSGNLSLEAFEKRELAASEEAKKVMLL